MPAKTAGKAKGRKHPTKSPEERKAEREAILGQIAGKVEALTSSEEWAAYLRFAGAFRQYSMNNIMLILAQCPHATHVAGFRVWKDKFNRHVVKGEKSIKILGYSPKKITEKDEDTGEDKVTGVIARFPILSVFDVSQTEGDDLPSGGFQVPEGDDGAGIWGLFTEWLTREGWTVELESIPGETRGYTDHKNKRVAIEETLAPAGRAATLMHEAGHVVLHADLAPGEYHEHRGVCETEAESVAYALGHMLGQPSDAKSIPYIAGWAKGDVELIQRTAANVLRAVNTIAVGIGLDEAPDSAPEASAA